MISLYGVAMRRLTFYNYYFCLVSRLTDGHEIYIAIKFRFFRKICLAKQPTFDQANSSF